MRLSRDVGQIAQEIVQHLAGLVDVELKVELAIEARAKDGIPDQVIRIVSENGKTLNFDSSNFEEE